MTSHWCAPACNQSGALSECRQYLETFGHLKPEEQDLQTGLKDLQRHARIPQTGNYDEQTRAVMSKPRCGVSRHRSSGPFAELRSHRGSWTKMPITYGFLNYTKDGPESPDLEKKMDEVVDRWSAVAQLEFIRASDPKDADIKISFGPKRHLDCKEIFDGPGGVLAHAYFPTREIGPMGGDMHFDEDETWDLDFFYQVALHEMGHSLGLDHSDVKEAVMDGFFDRKNELHDDDIRRIQELYGAK